MSKSDLEEKMALLIKMSPWTTAPKRQYRFAPPRRWKLDFAWPESKVALEVEGGTWVGGRHVRGKGFEADCEKYNELAAMGWRLIRVTSTMVKSGRAATYLERMFRENSQ